MTIALIERAAAHRGRTAIVDGAGEHRYGALLDASAAVARALLEGRRDLREARVAFMVTPGFQYAAVQWGIWRAGGVAVPLCLIHPEPELQYTVADTGARYLITDAANADRMAILADARGARLIAAEDAVGTQEGEKLRSIDETRAAMILYTSGTTSRPKGVVSTHANLRAQIESLVEAWEWSRDDRILLVLPLHHTHGIVNVLLCALWSGATCEMPGGFDARRVWERFAAGGLTTFMAVPTIYVRLIAEWERAPREQREAWSGGCRGLRLMVSGSAALPVSTFERWREITGQTLLERYGMTEIGMALSNPLHGERRPGTVGQPLPRVDVALLDEGGAPVPGDGTAGEIHVRGPTVFAEYWGRPDATSEAFRGGWFRTGDVAVIEDGYYRILGRSSVDIIKTGGYKVSALEIEEALREHPAVTDCAVVGIEDVEWGERVAAAVVCGTPRPSPEVLRDWMAARVAPYKVPRIWAFVDELPRNAMGKVVKVEVKELFAPSLSS